MLLYTCMVAETNSTEWFWEMTIKFCCILQPSPFNLFNSTIQFKLNILKIPQNLTQVELNTWYNQVAFKWNGRNANWLLNVSGRQMTVCEFGLEWNLIFLRFFVCWSDLSFNEVTTKFCTIYEIKFSGEIFLRLARNIFFNIRFYVFFYYRYEKYMNFLLKKLRTFFGRLGKSKLA